eukprot:1543591-Pleurochrysis_carterae.AAC.1
MSAAGSAEAVCTPQNVSYLAYHVFSFPIPPPARRSAACAVLSRTLAAREGDSRAALVEAMVSFHHAYQALMRDIPRRLLPEPAQAAYDAMSLTHQPATSYELANRARLPPCQGMAASFMPTQAPVQPVPSTSAAPQVAFVAPQPRSCELIDISTPSPPSSPPSPPCSPPSPRPPAGPPHETIYSTPPATLPAAALDI